ncbi:MAG: ZIP family metal transporter, partial [Fimbriimonadales bacterium]
MDWVQSWMPAHPIAQGLTAGIFIVSLNLLGALAILFLRTPSQRAQDTMLGFAAGVMLTAS